MRVFIDYNRESELFKYYLYDEESRVWKKPNHSSPLSEEHFTYNSLDIIGSELIDTLLKKYNPGNMGLIIGFHGEDKDYKKIKCVLEERKGGQKVKIYRVAKTIEEPIIPPPPPTPQPINVKIMINGRLFYDNKSWKRVPIFGGMHQNPEPDIVVRSEGNSRSKTLCLNEFAAYLWFRSQKSQLPSDFTLMVIDYYYKDCYARAYQMDSQGKLQCKRHISFHHLRTLKHIIKDLRDYDHAFRTFSFTDKKITIKHLDQLRIHNELEKCLNVLCGANADEELKLLLERFKISLPESKWVSGAM